MNWPATRVNRIGLSSVLLMLYALRSSDVIFARASRRADYAISPTKYLGMKGVAPKTRPMMFGDTQHEDLSSQSQDCGQFQWPEYDQEQLKRRLAVKGKFVSKHRYIDDDDAEFGRRRRRCFNQNGRMSEFSASKRMTYGYQAEYKQFPSYVRLEIFKRIPDNPFTITMILCGGTLIESDLVVTAAHCLDHEHDFLNAIAGVVRHNQRDHMQVSKAQYVCWHRYFRSRGDTEEYEPGWDLAILKLSKPFKFNEYVQPACVLTDEPPTELDSLYSVGYGSIDDHVESTRLNFLDVVLADCPPGSVQIESDTCYMARDQGHVCPGDSGSGLYIIRNETQFLAGVTSSVALDRDEPACSTRWKPKPAYYLDILKEQDELMSLVEACRS